MPPKKRQRSTPKSKNDDAAARTTARSKKKPSASPATAKKKKVTALQPPKELVKLLQTNKRVLDYFSSLHENLQGDVQVWKDRSGKWKKRAMEAEVSLQNAVDDINASKKQSEDWKKRAKQVESSLAKKERMLIAARKKHSSIENGKTNQTKKKSDHGEGSGGENENKKDELSLSSAGSSLQSAPFGAKAASSLDKKEAASKTSIQSRKGMKITDEMILMGLSSSSGSDSDASLSDISHDIAENAPHRQKRKINNDQQRNKTKNTIIPKEVQITASSPMVAAAQETKIANTTKENSISTNDDDSYEFRVTANPPSSTTDIDVIQMQKLREAYKCLTSLGASIVDILPIEEDEKEEENNGDVIKENKDQNPIQEQRQPSPSPNEDSSACSSDSERGNTFIVIPSKDEKDRNKPPPLNHSSPTEQSSNISSRIRRRSDANVASDVMIAIRTLVRCEHGGDSPPTTEKWRPFQQSNNTIFPCCYPVEEQKDIINEEEEIQENATCNGMDGDLACTNGTSDTLPNADNVKVPHRYQHPAVMGLQLICRALTIMDTWSFNTPTADCEEDMEECIIDDEGIANNGRGDNQIIRIGMQNRRSLVLMIQHTIEVEAATVWGIRDRSYFLITPGIHHYSDEYEEEKYDTHKSADTKDEQVKIQDTIQTLKKKDDEDQPTKDKDQEHISDPLSSPTNHPSSPSYTLDYANRGNSNRLTSIVERCMYTQIIASIHHARNDLHSLFRVMMDYILSSTPVLNSHVEDYPMLPPPLSLMVVEAFLRRNVSHKVSNESNSFHSLSSSSSAISWCSRLLNSFRGVSTSSSSSLSLAGRAIAFSIHSAARIWKQREHSSDTRIRDISAVEVAAYERLMVSEATWLIDTCKGKMCEMDENDNAEHRNDHWVFENAERNAFDAILSSVQDHLLPSSSCLSNEKPSMIPPTVIIDSLIALKLILVTQGDYKIMVHTCQRALLQYNEAWKMTVSNASNSNHNHDACRKQQQQQQKETCILVIITCFQVYQSINMVRKEALRTKRSFNASPGMEYLTSYQLGGEWDEVNGINEMSSVLEQLSEKLGVVDKGRVVPEEGRNGKRTFKTAANSSTDFWTIAATIAQCAVTLSDGGLVLRVAQLVTKSQLQGNNNYNEDGSMQDAEDQNTIHISKDIKVHNSKCLQNILDAGEFPTVRVINLKRRNDRWDSILVQAQKAQLLLVKGVIRLGNAVPSDASITTDIRSRTNGLMHVSSAAVKGDNTSLCLTNYDQYGNQLWGDHAYDGSGKAIEFERCIAEILGSDDCLERKFVQSRWRPGCLKAVDVSAVNHGKWRRMDPTERACALSHIASWKGVEHSLVRCKEVVSNEHIKSSPQWPFTHSKKDDFLRLFKISGFARGEALAPENKHLPPSPVCVILEDDAVLVDRFSERLAQLLEELPRDFHFCSLGYSRPKRAPMFDFSSQVGIPTFLWYLTGYVISLEGARFLSKSLPVESPIDTWIGFKMCSNWTSMSISSNAVGWSTEMSETLARLIYSKNAPTHNVFVRKMKFRCFAALIPLCSQRVTGTSSAAITARVSWRERDTDITYSGNS